MKSEYIVLCKFINFYFVVSSIWADVWEDSFVHEYEIFAPIMLPFFVNTDLMCEWFVYTTYIKLMDFYTH